MGGPCAREVEQTNVTLELHRELLARQKELDVEVKAADKDRQSMQRAMAVRPPRIASTLACLSVAVRHHCSIVPFRVVTISTSRQALSRDCQYDSSKDATFSRTAANQIFRAMRWAHSCLACITGTCAPRWRLHEIVPWWVCFRSAGGSYCRVELPACVAASPRGGVRVCALGTHSKTSNALGIKCEYVAVVCPRGRTVRVRVGGWLCILFRTRK